MSHHAFLRFYGFYMDRERSNGFLTNFVAITKNTHVIGYWVR